ncbi:MAG: hypothetical protein PHT02_14810, partial [Tissierellia bacterium]|nr:hypothetical protein [Tissierellia bacterium]
RLKHIRKEMYCVFIATLCEISKRGFSQGGILKQIDEYIGGFDRNHYYDLIKKAISNEGLKIIEKNGRYLEATIVYESGIPNKFHSNLYSLFKIYWKWLKGIDYMERRDFLRAFIEKKPIYNEYIIDKSDYMKMCSLRESMIDFQEKVIKTCIRIDKIFSEFDKINEGVNELNINDVCKKVSERLGYNVLTVIGEKNIKKDLIDYTYCVSFNKFENTISNLMPNEKIKLPSGEYVTNQQYSQSSFILGLHEVRNNIYEVVFPYGLNCSDYYNLKRNEIIKRNEHYIYISEDWFQVEIDGYEKPIRELIWNNEQLYIFVGKIPAASSACIDNKIINSEEKIKLKVSVRKYWDSTEKLNKLVLYLDEFKLFDTKYSMQSVCIRSNVSDTEIVRQINQLGHRRIIDKWFSIDKITDKLVVSVFVNENLIASKEVVLDDVYIYSLQTGIRIKDKVEWQSWFSDNRVVIFSKYKIFNNNIGLNFLDMFNNFYVYLGNIDFNNSTIKLDNTDIAIVTSDKPLIKLKSEVIPMNNSLCISNKSEICFETINCHKEGMFLKIIHEDKKFEGILLDELSDIKNITLSDCGISIGKRYGRWYVSLYDEQIKVCEFNFFVLSQVNAKIDKEIYEEGANVYAIVTATDNCFFVDGETTNKCKLNIGNAYLSNENNIICAKEIEFDISDSNCNFPYKFSLKPDVWGIRRKKDEILEKSFNRDLTIELTSNDELYIYSTISQKILFHGKDLEKYSYINTGINIVNLRKLKTSWQAVSKVTIFNYLGEPITFKVVFSARCNIKSFLYKNNSLILNFDYYGPIGGLIDLVVYINDDKYDKITKKVGQNNLVIEQEIKNVSNYDGQYVVVQVRYDGADPEVIFEDIIKITEGEKTDEISTRDTKKRNIVEQSIKELLLSNYINTLQLLDLENSDFELESVKFNTTDILSYLGRMY